MVLTVRQVWMPRPLETQGLQPLISDCFYYNEPSNRKPLQHTCLQTHDGQPEGQQAHADTVTVQEAASPTPTLPTTRSSDRSVGSDRLVNDRSSIKLA